MLGLPQSTELHRPLPKKAIFEKFKPSPADRQRIDADISRLAIVGEVSPATTNIAAGESVSAFYVLLASLKGADCDKRNIQLLSRLIGQNLLFVLERQGAARLAVFRERVVQSGWKPLEEWRLTLSGLNLDSVWDNVIVQRGGIAIADGTTLDEQIVADAEREKLLRRIERLEQQARTEKQQRRKWKLVEEVKQLKRTIEVQE
jgi:hypothetical protein